MTRYIELTGRCFSCSWGPEHDDVEMDAQDITIEHMGQCAGPVALTFRHVELDEGEELTEDEVTQRFEEFVEKAVDEETELGEREITERFEKLVESLT